MLLSKLNKHNEMGLRRLRSKLVKWTLIRNYLGGVDWATAQGARITAAQRLLGTTSDTGNIDDEPYVNNVMLRIHMSNMQRLGRFRPDIDVDPNENTLDDKKGARFGKIFLQNLMDSSKYDSRLRRKLDRNIAMYGSCYLKVSMDADSGAPESSPILDEFGKISGWNEDDTYEGEVVLDVPAPKNIVLPSHATDIHDADFAIQNEIRSVEYVLRKYNKTVKPEQINSKDVTWWKLGNEAGRDDKDGAKDDNLCFVREAWYRRCEEFPLGAHVIWAGKEVLLCTTLDDFMDGIPLFKSEFIYDDEDPDGDTPYWHMIPMQNALNRVEADIRRHAIMMSKPKWQQHMETVLSDPDGITNETAQILKWTGPSAPGIIAAPDLPQTVFTWRDMLVEEMMSLGAAHDIVRPKTGRSGTAIAYEQEQDDTTLAPTIWSMGVQHEEAFSFALKLCSQYYINPRRFTMRSKDGKISAAVFSGDELKGNFKVRVNMQSGLPANKIARQQLIVQLVNQQIITPQKAQQYFEFGEVDDAIRATIVAYERAEAIIENMENGQPYATMPYMGFDDLTIQMDQLKLVMQERWTDWDPGTQQNFFGAYNALLQMMLPPPQAPLPGGAPGPGGPQVGLNPGGAPPLGPPGMPGSGQAPGQQPPSGQPEIGNSLYTIPGMADEPMTQPPALAAK